MEKVPHEEQCRRILARVTTLTKGETDLIANLSNTAAVIKQFMEEVSWAGFYLIRGDTLVLGPFQGKPACKRIELGKGVCATAVIEDSVQVVPDVSQFPGHIACDKGSRSEIVLPLHQAGRVCAVLDLDSEQYDRFHSLEVHTLSTIVALLEQQCDWDVLG